MPHALGLEQNEFLDVVSSLPHTNSSAQCTARSRQRASLLIQNGSTIIDSRFRTDSSHRRTTTISDSESKKATTTLQDAPLTSPISFPLALRVPACHDQTRHLCGATAVAGSLESILEPQGTLIAANAVHMHDVLGTTQKTLITALAIASQVCSLGGSSGRGR